MNIESTEAVTAQAMSWALDVAMLRQQAVVSNIANANARGYVRQTVSFGESLIEHVDLLDDRGRADTAELMSLKPQVTPVSPGSATAVNFDMEVADMARNAVHYQSLLKGLSHHYRLLSMAASDGKR